MGWEAKERPYKDLHRIIAVEHSEKRKVETAFFMPSDTALCMQKAKLTGVIDKKTFIFMLEKDKTKIPALKRNVTKLGYKVINARQWDGEIIPGIAVLYSGTEKKVNLTSVEFDYGFFDFCGNITTSVMEFINRCSFSAGADVVFTFTGTYRKCDSEKILSSLPNFKRLMERGETILNNPFTEWYGQKGKDATSEIKTVVMLKTALHNYSTQLISCREYCDSQPMLLLRVKIQNAAVNETWGKVFDQFGLRRAISNSIFSKLATDLYFHPKLVEALGKVENLCRLLNGTGHCTPKGVFKGLRMYGREITVADRNIIKMLYERNKQKTVFIDNDLQKEINEVAKNPPNRRGKKRIAA